MHKPIFNFVQVTLSQTTHVFDPCKVKMLYTHEFDPCKEKMFIVMFWIFVRNILILFWSKESYILLLELRNSTYFTKDNMVHVGIELHWGVYIHLCNRFDLFFIVLSSLVLTSSSFYSTHIYLSHLIN